MKSDLEATAVAGDIKLVERITAPLVGTRGMSVKQLSAEIGVEKSVLNSALYSNRSTFRLNMGPPRTWTVRQTRARPAASVARRTAQLRPAEPFDPSSLYDWQQEALTEWRANGRHGIVEAVTGAGKTRLGMAAIHEALGSGERVAVIVPTIELQRQWVDNLRSAFAKSRIGRMGGDGRDDLETCEVLVAVGASARENELGLGAREGLLIADECHRYGAAKTKEALEEGFRARLGLSATYRRSDGAHETVLEPYFRGVVFELGYRRAIEDGVVAPFRVALLPVQLAPDERREYDELSEKLSRAKRTLITQFGVPPEPFEAFLAAVARLKSNGSMREGIAAGRYWGALTSRRKLLAETPAKLLVLDIVAGAMSDADRSIVFTQTIEGAELAARRLKQLGADTDVLHSRLPAGIRSETLGRFADGDLKVIVAPTLLDEGVDVPAADLALILAASQQRRQMIQRMGRVLRNKADGRQARFAISYVVGTSEDPDRGAHEAFLGEVLDVAADVHRFSLGASPGEVRAYLEPAGATIGAIPAEDKAMEVTRTRPNVVLPGSTALAGTRSAKAIKAERTADVALLLGLSVEELLHLRRERAAAMVGTKGMARQERARLVAGVIGRPVEFVDRWDAAESCPPSIG